MDRTGAALAGIATNVCARQRKVFPQKIYKKRTVLYLAGRSFAVYGQGNGWHPVLLSMRKWRAHSIVKLTMRNVAHAILIRKDSGGNKLEIRLIDEVTE